MAISVDKVLAAMAAGRKPRGKTAAERLALVQECVAAIVANQATLSELSTPSSWPPRRPHS